MGEGYRRGVGAGMTGGRSDEREVESDKDVDGASGERAKRSDGWVKGMVVGVA